MSALAHSLRVKDFDLAGTISWQRDAIRNREYDVKGRMTEIRLGIDARAEYFKGEAWSRVSRSSKVMGLTLSWTKDDAPWIAFAKDRQTPLLIGGIARPPKIAVHELRLMKLDKQGTQLPAGVKWKGAQLVADNKNGLAKQNMWDFASGYITGRDGTKFVILQPAEQLIVLANCRSGAFGSSGTILNLKGDASFDGRYPALLVSPVDPSAHFVGGLWSFQDW